MVSPSHVSSSGRRQMKCVPTAALFRVLLAGIAILGFAGCVDGALAHGIGGKAGPFVAATRGTDILPFLYLGAKHMVTGYDHLLFIFGVIFFLYRMKDVLVYV